MEKINLMYEITKLFPALEIILPTSLLDALQNATVSEIPLFHFGLGTFIRNHFLTPTAKLYDVFVKASIPHKDDMSTMILESFCEHLKQNKRL